MNKNYIFEEYCRVIEEDGTKDDLREVYLAHPQEDPFILKRACEKMSDFVSFCMEIVSYYWSEHAQDYRQFLQDETDAFDYTRWKIKMVYEKKTIYPETDIDPKQDTYLYEMIKLFQLRLGYKALFHQLLSNQM